MKTKIFLALILSGFLITIGTAYYYLKTYGHETQRLVNYTPSSTSIIYDRNGIKIANVFSKRHRFYVPFDQIPPQIIEALLAIEDTSFFEHHGINLDAIFRAVLKDIKAGGLVEGASTLTQQLVKNVLLTREKKISRKLKEILFSLKVETELSKTEILERYLNEIYLGHGYYGIKTAADGYFHKKLKNLTLKEISMLVGLPKAPSYYSPTRRYEISLGRANRVVKRLFELGWISKNRYKLALKERPEVFNDTLTQNKAPYIVDEVIKEMNKKVSDFKTGGYEVYTSIDIKMQEKARDALEYSYNLALQRAADANEYNESNFSSFNGALISLDPRSGDILAMVGGVNYKKSSYNRAIQARRQPGSAFKPFIYQVAIDMGYSGASELVDIARTYSYEKDGEELKWRPKNYEKNYVGFIPLRESLVHSRNLSTINLVTDIGLKQVLNSLKEYGIKNLPPDLSVALGSITVSPINFAKYFSSFAANGVQVEPVLIRKIKSSDGNIFEYESKHKKITSPTQAYIMTSILQDVVRRGTGRMAKVWGVEVAGKTGTTNKAIDAWFVGYTPEIETIVWFGNDNNTPMRRREVGGRLGGPAFAYFNREVYKMYPHLKREFEVPKGILEVDLPNGKKEFFSDISKPPIQKAEAKANDELLF